MDNQNINRVKYCANCGSKLAFKMVLAAVNPLRVPCQSCKTPIKVNVTHGVIAVMLVLFLAIVLFYLLREIGLAIGPIFFSLVVLGLIVEYAYYKALEIGIVSSTLTTEKAE